MKNQLQLLAVIVLCAALGPVHAQVGAGPAPQAPMLGGATAKLFGNNSSFSANVEIQAGSPAPTTGRLSYSEGKSRFDVDLIKLSGGNVTDPNAKQIKAMGMDTMAMISRPDLKVRYMLYPNLNAFVENPLAEAEAAKPDKFKLETTWLGTETVDGHACVKNKVVTTDDKGVAHESTVWNATDLKNFPVRIQQTEGGVTTTMTFKDVKLAKVESSVFDTPSGAKKYGDLTTMMQAEVMARMMRGRAGP